MREQMIYNPGYYQLRENQLLRMLSIVNQTKTAKSGGVVFFGDSITEMYDLDKYYENIPIKYNCGIGGATSQELLWFIDEAVIKYQPKIVVLMIGINDLGYTTMISPRQIAVNIKEIIDVIRGNCPQTYILLLSTLPCIEELKDYHHIPGIRNNDLVQMIFQECQLLIMDKKTIMVPIYHKFVDENGCVLKQYYQDGLHLNENGYQYLTTLILPYIKQIEENHNM